MWRCRNTRPNLHRRRWVLGARRWWVVLAVVLAACGSVPPPSPTITPRPTLPPRTPPTAIPTAVVADRLMLGVARGVVLPGGAFVELPYTAEAAQTVTITARALTDDGAGNVLDVVLEVLDGEMNRVAYNDDGAATLDGFAPMDAALVGLPLAAGGYVVRVNAFNGFQAGDVEVKIDEAP